MTSSHPDHPIFCDCCNAGRREVLAMRRGDKIIIRSKRHGKEHMAVVVVQEDGTADLKPHGLKIKL